MFNQIGGLFPQSVRDSPVVFPHQNSIQTPPPISPLAQLNSQHVFPTNRVYQNSPQSLQASEAVMNFIRNTPPPAISTPGLQQLLANREPSLPLHGPSYPPSLSSIPRAFTDCHQLNGTFTNLGNGFPAIMQQFQSQNSPPTSFNMPPPLPVPSHPESRSPGSLNQRSLGGPSTFQPRTMPRSGNEMYIHKRNGLFNQQFHNMSSTFPQQTQTNGRNGSFNQQSPTGPSDFQQYHTNIGNGTFNQLSPNGSSGFQQQSCNSRPEVFHQQQSSNSNNYHHTKNNRNNNSFYKVSNNKNSNYQNNRQNNWKGSSKNTNRFQDIKKEREDRRALKPYSCDSCDQYFDTEIDLRIHLSNHIKCDTGNCQFEANPQLVYLHKKMQHVSDYAEKISKLNNPEEIEKWRAERRKRFPTQENIARRQAERAEKEARGEVIETPVSTGQMKRKGDFKGKSRNFKKRRNNRGRNHSVSFIPKMEEDDVPEIESSDDEQVTQVPMFRGVNAVISLETDVDSANCCESSVNEVITINSPSNGSEPRKDSANESLEEENTSTDKSGTSNLVVYDLSDDEAPVELSSKRIPGYQSPPSSQEACDQVPEEKTVNNTHSPKKANATGFKKDQERPRKKREFVPRIKEEPKRCTNSLLKAIYADEIKSERNKVFQCIRFIVQNNFFQN